MGIKELLKLTKEAQKEALEKLSNSELIGLAEDAVKMAKERKIPVGMLGNKTFLKLEVKPSDDDDDVDDKTQSDQINQKRRMIINTLLGVLAKIPAVMLDSKLALDREFGT